MKLTGRESDVSKEIAGSFKTTHEVKLGIYFGGSILELTADETKNLFRTLEIAFRDERIERWR